MKRLLRPSTLCTAALTAALVTAGSAQAAAPQNRQPVTLKRVKATFKKLDGNADGSVSLTEAGKASMSSSLFKRHDDDRSRGLDIDEFAVLYKELLVKEKRPVGTDLTSEVARIQAGRRSEAVAKRQAAEVKRTETARQKAADVSAANRTKAEREKLAAGASAANRTKAGREKQAGLDAQRTQEARDKQAAADATTKAEARKKAASEKQAALVEQRTLEARQEQAVAADAGAVKAVTAAEAKRLGDARSKQQADAATMRTKNARAKQASLDEQRTRDARKKQAALDEQRIRAAREKQSAQGAEARTKAAAEQQRRDDAAKRTKASATGSDAARKGGTPRKATPQKATDVKAAKRVRKPASVKRPGDADKAPQKAPPKATRKSDATKGKG